MGFPLPNTGRRRLDADRTRDGVVSLRASNVSPLDRRSVLPPHHPHRRLNYLAFPYALWSAGLAQEPVARAPDVIDLRGDRLKVTVNLRRGGRIVGACTREGVNWRAITELSSTRDDVRGAGPRGGLEVNTSPFPRSPWALDPVHAAVGLPTRLGGDRLRWWELERASGHLAQIDFHLPDGGALLLVVVRQTALDGGRDLPEPTLHGDDAHLPAVARGSLGDVTWYAVPFEDGATVSAAQLDAAVAGLDDPVLRSSGRMISHGPGWAALEIARLVAEGREVPFDLAATPVAALEHEEIANRLRLDPETQWLHLLRDEGLGVIDRVHPKDVGQPAGRQWEHLLQRSRHREALGDWRVHLRLGELAFLNGDLPEAEARWGWSYSLRPTAWSDRNLGLLEAARGRVDLAAVHHLRAQRTQPDEVELGIEAIGVLLASDRVGDTRQVLDRMTLAGHAASARYWLLEAEVARAGGRQQDLIEAMESAERCVDAHVHHTWIAQLRDGCEPSP